MARRGKRDTNRIRESDLEKRETSSENFMRILQEANQNEEKGEHVRDKEDDTREKLKSQRKGKQK